MFVLTRFKTDSHIHHFMQGALSVIKYHNNSLTQALKDLLPGLNLDNSKLWRPGIHGISLHPGRSDSTLFAIIFNSVY